MTLGIPSFDSLAHAAALAPEGYALYHKSSAREYIKARNEFIEFVGRTASRSDMTAEMKIIAIQMRLNGGLK
jgi:hypothetical protein